MMMIMVMMVLMIIVKLKTTMMVIGTSLARAGRESRTIASFAAWVAINHYK